MFRNLYCFLGKPRPACLTDDMIHESIALRHELAHEAYERCRARNGVLVRLNPLERPLLV